MRTTAVATEKRHAVRVPRAPNTALIRNMPSSHPSCYSRISIPHAGNPKMYYSIEGALGSPDSSTALLHLNTNLVHHWDTSSSSSLCFLYTQLTTIFNSDPLTKQQQSPSDYFQKGLATAYAHLLQSLLINSATRDPYVLATAVS